MVTGNGIVSLIVIKNQLDVTSTYNERLHANKTVFIYLSFYRVQRWDTHTHEKNCSASWKNVLTWRLLKNVYNKSSFLLKCAEINLLSVGVQLWVLNSYVFFSLTIRVYFIHTVGVRVCPQCSVIVGKLKKS